MWFLDFNPETRQPLHLVVERDADLRALLEGQRVSMVASSFRRWVTEDQDFGGELLRTLQYLGRLMDPKARLLFEVEDPAALGLLRRVLELSRWGPCRVFGGSILEAVRHPQPRESFGPAFEGLVDAIPAITAEDSLDGLVVDPLAQNLQVMEAAKAAGLGSVLVMASHGLEAEIQRAGGHPAETAYTWLPRFLDGLRQGESIRKAVELAGTHRSQVYRLMESKGWLRSLVSTHSPGGPVATLDASMGWEQGTQVG